jgi:hypothetical protein
MIEELLKPSLGERKEIGFGRKIAKALSSVL